MCGNCFFLGFKSKNIGKWCEWLGTSTGPPLCAALSCLSHLDSLSDNPSLSDAIAIFNELSQLVAPDATLQNTADSPILVIHEATERLSRLVVKDATTKLADVLAASDKPTEAKALLNKFFPKAPPKSVPKVQQMFDAVAAIVATGAAYSLDSNAIAATTKSLCAASRQLSCSSVRCVREHAQFV